jgi:hypothetical protein
MCLSTVRMDSATTTGSRGFMTLYFSCKGIGNRSAIQQSSKGDKDLLKLYWNRVPVLFIWCPEGAVTKYDCRACQANRAVPVAGKLATVCSPFTNAVASSTSSLTDAVSKSLVTGSPIVLQEKNLASEQWTARVDLIMKICCSYLTKVYLFNHEDIVLLFDQSAFFQKSCYNKQITTSIKHKIIFQMRKCQLPLWSETHTIVSLANSIRFKRRLTARILKSPPVFGAYSNFLPSLPSLSPAPCRSPSKAQWIYVRKDPYSACTIMGLRQRHDTAQSQSGKAQVQTSFVRNPSRKERGVRRQCHIACTALVTKLLLLGLHSNLSTRLFSIRISPTAPLKFLTWQSETKAAGKVQGLCVHS